MSILTPSQQKALKNFEFLLENNRGVCVSGSGKNKVIREYLVNIEEKIILSYKDILTDSIRNGPQLSTRLNQLLSEINNKNILYIPNFDLIVSATSSYNFKMGTLSTKIWHDFFKNIKINFLISCSKNTALDIISKSIWFLNIETTNDDRKFLLESILGDGYDELLKYVKNTSLKTINIAATHAKYQPDIIEGFKKTLTSLDSRALDVRNKVVQPTFEVDMVGLESIVEELRREIISPILLGCKEIPICKGIVLHGPSGTGKSTIGRWLSHELEGRVYLAETSSNDTLMSSFTRLLKLACVNAPSVVFLDDFESILESSCYVRELLVLLDGINVRGRENVCIVATCMNIGNIPEALIRGGRLEKCIEFKYPSKKIITQIIKNRFDKIIRDTNNLKLSETLSRISFHVSDLSKYLIGWSPSNIQLIIDSVIRKIVYSDKIWVNEEIFALFKDESYRINQSLKQSLRGINTSNPVERGLYN